MKKCPYCAEEIQDEAKVCRYCQRDVNPLAQPIPRPEPVRAGHKGWWLAVAVGFLMSTFYSGGLFGPGGIGFFVMWIGIAMASSSTPVSRWVGGFLFALLLMIPGFVLAYKGAVDSLTATSSTADTERLELLASRGERGEHYHKVFGQVKNLTSKPIDNVKVVVTWLTDADEFVVSDSALIDYRPLMPGQTSPFSTITSANPLMKQYRVEFSTLRGAVIGFRDSRK